MQIHRIHAGGLAAPAYAAVRKGGLAGEADQTNAVSRELEVGGAVGNGELEQLTRQLGEYSEVRADVVAAAKVRVQRGDYLTRAAAEQIADALLSRDA